MKEIVSRVAALGFPEHRFRGHAVFAELVGAESYASMIALAVSGRRLSQSEAAVLDDLAAVTTVADPRIWPLKLTRVVSSYGSLLAGFAAGQLPLEGDRIGPPITVHAAQMLVDLRTAVGDRFPARDEIVKEARLLVAKNTRLVGYGIPFRPYDERYVVLRERLIARGRSGLPFFVLHDVLNDVVREVRNLPPNIGIGTAAMLLDLGFTPHEAAAVVHFVNQHVFIANAFEGAQQMHESLRRLPDDAVCYGGMPPRQSPRAARGR